MASKFESLLKKNRYELTDLQNKSKSWFNAQVSKMRDVRTIQTNVVMRGDAQSKGNRILPGTLVMFQYDPKLKDVLPYYDVFPMVLPFRAVPGGFYGLNLHYLPYQLRARLLDRLLDFKTTKGLTENTRLKFSWQMLDGMSRFAPAKPCVKHYLYEHVVSPFKTIHPDDWGSAVMLPLERFVGMTPQEVWRESTRIIARG